MELLKSADHAHHLVAMFTYPEKEALETKTLFERNPRKLYLE